ncbi:MAG: DUF4197 domain-containing protein [Desulfovibrio sp.]
MLKIPMKTMCCMCVAVLIAMPIFSYAGWGDVLKQAGESIIKEKTGGSTSATTGTTSDLTSISVQEAIQGLKSALDVAVDRSLDKLGAANGFLNNPKVAIPVPESLNKIDTALQLVGKGELVDNFVGSMNKAAEQAAPETQAIFLDAIKGMSFQDAKGILQGGNTAATDYFERTTRSDLMKIVMPVVEKATSSVDVTKYYKNLALAAQLAGYAPEAVNLDDYVAGKTLDGIFTVMGEEESRIRKDPVARSTDILRTVFGAL